MKTLRPGFLVSLKSTVTGGVNYQRIDLDAPDKEEAGGAAVARWETTKKIDDPAEFERATKIRGKARNLIAAICATSEFGLLCPASREFDLKRAIEEAKRLADEHNATARKSFVRVYAITGRIAQDDAEAARAVSSEVRGLLDEMERGIAAANPEAIREAARKAKNLGAMLTDDAAAKVTGAIEQAREAARAIVKRIQKDGESAAAVVAECKLDEIRTARFAFLDLDETGEASKIAPVAAAIEMDPEGAAAEPPALPSDDEEDAADAAASTPAPLKPAAPSVPAFEF